MVDHPGWLTSADGHAQRAFRSEDAMWMLTCQETNIAGEPDVEVVHLGACDTGSIPVIDWFDPLALPPPFRDTPDIRHVGRLYRVRGTDLWDAIFPAVLRQNTNSQNALHRYRSLCTALGESITTPLGTVLIAPRAKTVAAAGENVLGELAQRNWTRHAQTAAAGFVDGGMTWAIDHLDELYHELRQLPHVGKATAAGVVADLSNDFSYYDFVDFGSVGRWEQFAHATGTNVADYQAVWNVLTRAQRSTLAALSIHWRSRRFRPAATLRFSSHSSPPDQSSEESRSENAP